VANQEHAITFQPSPGVFSLDVAGEQLKRYENDGKTPGYYKAVEFPNENSARFWETKLNEAFEAGAAAVREGRIS
jgi:hypothetical protein